MAHCRHAADSLWLPCPSAGYPLVDAGMRQLWSTGWLHNRIRVVCASFLVKNLLLPWQWGLKHYWDALLDADLECAALGWQYCSGCLAGERAGSAWEGWSLGRELAAVFGAPSRSGLVDWHCMVMRACNPSCHQVGEVLRHGL